MHQLINDKAYNKLDKSLFTPEDLELAGKYEEYRKRLDEEWYITDVSYESRLADKAKEKESKLITEWFSEEEIRDFIIKNMAAAKNEEERKIDEMISEINKKFPETLEYYEFPDEWEENGLAEMIRCNCNID